MIQKRIVLVQGSPSPFVVPSDFGSLVSIECLGSGGTAGTGSGAYLGGGSGGGAYAKITTLSAIAAGNTYAFNIAPATDTWFDTVGTVLAKCGSSTSSIAGATGGQASSSIGTTKFSGGNGGNGFAGGSLSAGGGGGGAAGPNGAGVNGTNASSGVGGTGGAGDNGFGGAGGAGGVTFGPSFPPVTGVSGSHGTEYSSTLGCGGGGGGAVGGLGSGSYGGSGGYYGAGAGYGYPGDQGLPGFIIFTYNSALTPIMCRKCVRLAEPNDTTIEQSYPSPYFLQVTVNMPLSLVQQYAALIPTTGPDTLVINYFDSLGQPQQLTRSLTLWMSENGYCFIGSDSASQFLIASVNPTFWQANAATINARNSGANATALLPCCNVDRYGANTLLDGQAIPPLFVYDGVVIPTPN